MQANYKTTDNIKVATLKIHSRHFSGQKVHYQIVKLFETEPICENASRLKMSDPKVIDSVD